MTIRVEDGSGMLDSNSYVPLSYVDTYADDRKISSWAANPLLQEPALVRSAEFITLRYGRRLSGTPVNPGQSLAYPRNTVEGNTGIPEPLKKAQTVLAILFVENNGQLKLDANAENGRVVSSSSVSLGNGAFTKSTGYTTVAANKAVMKNIFAEADAYMAMMNSYIAPSAFVPTVRG